MQHFRRLLVSDLSLNIDESNSSYITIISDHSDSFVVLIIRDGVAKGLVLPPYFVNGHVHVMQ